MRDICPSTVWPLNASNAVVWIELARPGGLEGSQFYHRWMSTLRGVVSGIEGKVADSLEERRIL